MNPQTLPVIAAEAITRPNQIVNALLARSVRAHGDDDYVLILQANKRAPEIAHPLGSRCGGASRASTIYRSKTVSANTTGHWVAVLMITPH
jgi:hypothetical protein